MLSVVGFKWFFELGCVGEEGISEPPARGICAPKASQSSPPRKENIRVLHGADHKILDARGRLVPVLHALARLSLRVIFLTLQCVSL